MSVELPGDPASLRAVSALSTGGAGTIFEYQVAAVALVALLRGDSVPGLPGAVDKVRLQQRNAGSYLDDVHAFDNEGRRVEFPVKRTVDVVASNNALKSTISQCLDTVRDHGALLDDGVLRMGLVANGSAPALESLKRLTALAREHDEPGTFAEHTVAGALDGSHRDCLDVIDELVAGHLRASGVDVDPSVVATATHRVLLYLRVWHVEDDEDATEIRHAKNRLGDLIPAGSSHNSSGAFGLLCQIAQTVGPQGGTLTRARLRTRLAELGLGLSSDPALAPQLAAMQQQRDDVLHDVKRDLGSGYSIDRSALINGLVEVAGTPGITVVSGKAGAGKSVLARQSLEAAATAGAHTTAINLSTHQVTSLPALNTAIGIDIGLALSGAPTDRPRMLLIDGAEQVMRDGSHLLGQLLTEVRRSDGDAMTWSVILVCRADAVDLVTDYVGQALTVGQEPADPEGDLRAFTVGDLTDDEIDGIVARYPALRPLRRHPRGVKILRRPFLVDVLLRASATVPASGAIGEETMVDVFWEDIVRQREASTPRGLPDARAAVCSRLATHQLTHLDPAPVDGLDPTALAGLRSDDITKREQDRDEFAHDVLTDYACAFTLAAPHNRHLYAEIRNPRRMLRAVRLSFQHRLTAAAGDAAQLAEVWTAIVSDAAILEARDGPRWRDVPYEALIGIGHPDPALAAIAGALTSEQAGTVWDLVSTTRRTVVEHLTQFGGQRAAPVSDLDSTLAAPVVKFLIGLGDAVPVSARVVSLTLARDLLATGEPQAGSEFDPAVWGDAITGWVGEPTWGADVDAALAAVGLLGTPRATAVETFLERVSEDRSDELDNLVEDPSLVSTAARVDPELLFRAARTYYLDIPFGTSAATATTASVPDEPADPLFGEIGVDGFDEDGVRDHSARFSVAVLADPTRGPFLAVLDAAPDLGLALVADVVAAATTARISLEETWEGFEPLVIPLRLGGEVREWVGTQHIYQWVRGSSVGSLPAMSALMALRQWSITRAADEPLVEVRDRILQAGPSVAFVATAVSVLVARLDDVVDELDPFFEQPALWHSEIARSVAEHSIAHRVPEDERTAWGPLQVASMLTLRHPERQPQLVAVGEALVANARAAAKASGRPDEDLDDGPAVLSATAWAHGLDIDNWRSSPSETNPGYVEVSSEPPADLVDKLSDLGGARAVASLVLTGRLHDLVATRDRGRPLEPSVDLDALWDDTTAEIATSLQLDPSESMAASSSLDVEAALAAVIVIGAADGHATSHLEDAVRVLVAAANRTRTRFDPTDFRHDRSTVWPDGFDRSAATALGALVANPTLLALAELSVDELREPILHLAQAVSKDTRRRLADALHAAMEVPCADNATGHVLAADALTMMVAVGGVRWDDSDYHFEPVLIPEPLPDSIRTDDRLDLSVIADALSVVLHASDQPCVHADGLGEVGSALIETDLATWPSRYAGGSFGSGGTWRRTIDTHIATRALAGDDELLWRYVEEWGPWADQLTGVIAALAEVADSFERVAALMGLWPRLLTELGPDNRALEPFPDGGRRHRRDAGDLDRALLPLPAGPVDGEALTAMIQIMVRWAPPLAGKPHMADRLLDVMVGVGVIGVPAMNTLLMFVCGTDAPAVDRDFRRAVAWLRLVLLQHPAALDDLDRPQALRLVDDLAILGNPVALALQRDLEI